MAFTLAPTLNGLNSAGNWDYGPGSADSGYNQPPIWKPAEDLQNLYNNGTLAQPTAQTYQTDSEGNQHMTADFTNQYWDQLPNANINGKPIAASDLAAYNPNSTAGYINPNFHTVDQNYGDVTSMRNQKESSGFLDKIGSYMPAAFIAAMTMQPELVGAGGLMAGGSDLFGASNMMKLPGLVDKIGQGNYSGAAGSAIPWLAKAFGS